MAGNRDDHLRNHGCLRVRGGWCLSPAFDMNPIADAVEHALAIDERQARPDLGAAIDTAELYRLARADAQRIVAGIRAVVTTWGERARALDLPKAEVALMAPAFDAVR